MNNGVLIQYFEWNLPDDGELWDELARDAGHLAERGITAVWIPPAYKADEVADEGYATYDLYDFGEFDQKGGVRTKYGTCAELENAIKALHDAGLQVILDTVLNHKAGGDYTERFKAVAVDPTDRNRSIGRPHIIVAKTGYRFPGRGNRYSPFKWHWYDFSGVDFDMKREKGGVFRIVGPGKGWSEGVDTENGNYDYLLANDIDLNRKEVRRELFHWGRWAVRKFGFDGMRMDAIKHMDYNFTRDFVASVRENAKADLYAVGEYWSGDIGTLLDYLKKTENTLDLFDVPFHYNMHQASVEESDYDLRNLMRNTLVEQSPQHAVTFVENHDTQPGSSLESTVADWFKPMAYALILLMKEGYPVIFYGDYYSEKGVASPHREVIDMLLDIRKDHAHGDQTLYFDDPKCVALSRHGDREHPGLVLLLCNDEDATKHIELGAGHAGEKWHDISGHDADELTLDENGGADFQCPGRTFAVWVKC